MGTITGRMSSTAPLLPQARQSVPRSDVEPWLPSLTDAGLVQVFDDALDALCKRLDVRLYHADGAAYLIRCAGGDHGAPGCDFPIREVRSEPL